MGAWEGMHTLPKRKALKGFTTLLLSHDSDIHVIGTVAEFQSAFVFLFYDALVA